MNRTPAETTAIEAVDLRKRYGDVQALAGLSLRVERGRIVGLIGPDGAGKTTVMRIICGLLRPDGGQVRVLGHEVASGGRAIKERLGYMPQRFSLYPDLSVLENLRFFADLFLVTGEQRERQQTRLLEFSRLADFGDRRAGRLSGGMKQKLALACTLIHTPEVLVLDEPTTGVDPVSRQEFWRILRDLAGDGLGLLVSTPYMDEAGLCDSVTLVHDGRELAAGSPAEVAGRFRGDLLAITGPDLGAARERLLGIPDLAVHRFGDRLHAAHDPGRVSRQAIDERLAGLEVTVAPIAPSIEDAFVSLVTGARTATGGDP